jgi:hypothetical protein
MVVFGRHSPSRTQPCLRVYDLADDNSFLDFDLPLLGGGARCGFDYRLNLDRCIPSAPDDTVAFTTCYNNRVFELICHHFNDRGEDSEFSVFFTMSTILKNIQDHPGFSTHPFINNAIRRLRISKDPTNVSHFIHGMRVLVLNGKTREYQITDFSPIESDWGLIPSSSPLSHLTTIPEDQLLVRALKLRPSDNLLPYRFTRGKFEKGFKLYHFWQDGLVFRAKVRP